MLVSSLLIYQSKLRGFQLRRPWNTPLKWTYLKTQNYVILESTIGNIVSPSGCNWQRMRICAHHLPPYPLRLGTGCNSGSYNPKQAELGNSIYQTARRQPLSGCLLLFQHIPFQVLFPMNISLFPQRSAFFPDNILVGLDKCRVWGICEIYRKKLSGWR